MKKSTLPVVIFVGLICQSVRAEWAEVSSEVTELRGKIQEGENTASLVRPEIGMYTCV